MARIGVSDTRIKDALEFGYLAALCVALGDALGCDMLVRVVMRMLT